MYGKILVPLDGSALAERAVEPALLLAGRGDGELIFLSIPYLETTLIPDSAGSFGGYTVVWSKLTIQHAQDEAERYLAALAETAESRAVTVRTEVITGQVSEVIVDTAAAEGVDLIVMSSHGRSGIERWIYGSVAERVLRHAPCPVLVIRSRDAIRRVLIPLDGSQLSEAALEPGLAVAAAFGADVTLLRVVPRMSSEEIARLNEIEADFGPRWQDQILQEANQYLHGLVATQQPVGVQIEAAVTLGPAASSLLDFAAERGIGLLAMATHGRSGVRRWVYGSVTEKTLHGARCSMLIVRPPDGVNN